MNWHVLPVNDFKTHKEDENCHCKPRVEVVENGNKVIVHNSYDGRELNEKLQNL